MNEVHGKANVLSLSFPPPPTPPRFLINASFPQSWRSYLYQRSKVDRFKMVQRDPLPPGSNPLGDDTMTVDVMSAARSTMFKNHEFCLVSSNDSMAELARRLRGCLLYTSDAADE